MKQQDVFKQRMTPIGAPAYPHGPYRFTNRECFNSLFPVLATDAPDRG